MLPSRRVPIAAAVVCAIAISASASGTALAAHPAPKGTLSALEYKQLAEELTALKKFDHNKRATWSEGFAACDRVGHATALLSSVRANCNQALGIDQSFVGFYTQAARCAAFTTTGTTTTTTPTGTTTTGTATGTTTTGTTTTGTTVTGTTTTGTTTTGTTTTSGFDPTQLRFIACLAPEYQLIGRAAKALYTAQVNLRAQVLARHFVGRCLLTLAPRRTDLELMRRFVTTSAQLATDVQKLSKVFSGTLPAGDLNENQVNQDAAAFIRVGQAVGRVRRPQNLAVCPHLQPAK